jgi:amino acid transporter
MGSPRVESATAGLPRRLGLWSSIAVVIGLTIGSGIFRTPAVIATRLPGPLAMLGVWTVGGLVALCGALTLAETAAAYPETGGIYVYIRNAFGRLPAFLFGWTELTIIGAAALAAISTTFAEYFLRVLGMDPSVAPYDDYVHYVAAVAIALVATINYVGVSWSVVMQNITTVSKFIGLLLIIIGALAIGLPRTGGHFTPLLPAGSFSVAPFGVALVSILWAYDGWAELAYLSGEVTNPRRNVPLALILGTAAVVTIYVLANIAYLSVLSVDEIRQSKLVAADVAFRLVGRPGVAMVAITVMLSTLGTLNGSILTTPRIFFAMAADRLLFRGIAGVHPRFQTPHVAITISAVLGIAFVMVRTFEQLADTFVTAILPFYALGVASIFVFRRRGIATPFRTPLYPLTPLIFIAATMYLLGSALVDHTSRGPTLAIFGVIVAGIPIFYLTVGRSGRSTTALVDAPVDAVTPHAP